MERSSVSAPRRIWQALKSRPQNRETEQEQKQVQAKPSEQPFSMAALDQQGLFIIGAARSGTTVLQNALNSSPDIFLLGEPVLHQDPGTKDFSARYNAMHRSWGNQENKSSFCPSLLNGDGTWQEYLTQLATLYRYVGSKIVVNPEHARQTCQELFEFHCRQFYRSHYVFTFRNPIDVLMSTRGLAELLGSRAESYEVVLKSFLHVIALYTRFLRNLPNVTAVFHEDIDKDVFQRTGEWLAADLGNAPEYYDQARVRHYTLEEVPEHSQELAINVIEIYQDLRRQHVDGVRLVQLEQNSHHILSTHFTPLGALHKRIEQILGTP
jgi:hypothetical protein